MLSEFTLQKQILQNITKTNEFRFQSLKDLNFEHDFRISSR